MKHKRILITLLFGMIMYHVVSAQAEEFKYIPAEVDFSRHLRKWDGFGFNYVETAQTRDYDEYPQDYGGFSLLSPEKQEEIVQLVFGEDGLQVQIVKMFLDPYHQRLPGGAFNHERTTVQMRSFVKRGIEITRERGDEPEIITTLYGPPAWATRQEFTGGRDLDKNHATGLGIYMADWVRYLKENDYPVKYLSLHNEGEDFYRWDYTDGSQRLERFDYNMYWPPEQVNAFLKLMPGILESHGLGDIKITNGEPSNWTRFYYWGYADALYNDDQALENLGLLTTHGFINGDMGKLSYGTANDLTTNLLRKKKPGLHAWVTSFSWGDMGTQFVRMVHEHLYTAGVNAIIPWAGIQHPAGWVDGDPNPGTAFRVDSSGNYEVLTGYYIYKQLTRAGKRGMHVAHATLANPVANLIAFTGNHSGHPDAFIVSSNIFIWSLPLEIKIKGTTSSRFMAYRSSDDGEEKYSYIGEFEVVDGAIIYDPPRGTVTTFIALD
jgi:O-glycosyl hydrolase